jgi:hypothetical protein
MRSSLDMEPAIAELKAIANLIRGLALAAEHIKSESDSLRRVSASLLHRANELELFMREALDASIAERAEHEALPGAVRAERDPSRGPSDGQSEAPRDLLASWAKMVAQQAKERSATLALPIVVMAANLKEAPA